MIKKIRKSRKKKNEEQDPNICICDKCKTRPRKNIFNQDAKQYCIHEFFNWQNSKSLLSLSFE